MALDESISDGQPGHLTDHDTIHTKVNQLTWGTGSPEGVVTAAVGALFLRTDGGTSTTLYIKETGAGNTGWVASGSTASSLPLAGGTMSGTLAMGNQELSGSLDPTGGTHLGDRDYNDARYDQQGHSHTESDISDLSAIHDDVASEISGITAKGTPINGDFLLIEDSASSNVKKRITVGDLPSSGTSPLTTKGDVFTYDTSDARLPVGSNTQVLTADSAQTLGVKWATPASSSGGLSVSRETDVTLTASGVYLVNSAAAVRTVTLPALSAAPSDGFRITIKREGTNFVDVDCAGADEYEPGSVTSKRLFTNWSAISLFADDAANYWYLLGFYGSIT